MNAAYVALVILLFGLLLLGLEYLWLYILAISQESRIRKYNTARRKTREMIDSIFYSPTIRSRKNELEALRQYVGEDYVIMEMARDVIKTWDGYGAGDFTAYRQDIMRELEETLRPVDFYLNMLREGDKHAKSHACRMLAELNALDALDEIRELMKSSNRILSYNAAMALSQLGDNDSVVSYIKANWNDSEYSDRLIFEMLKIFTGDKEYVAEQLYAEKDQKFKAYAINAFAPYALTKFAEYYQQETKSTSTDMKISAVKALSALGDPTYSHDLVLCAKDRNWVIRINAIHGLEKLETAEALQCVIDATKDKEWWVRQTAAQSLLKMNVSVRELENIMRGNDRYAADAVKYSLYRKIDIKGNLK